MRAARNILFLMAAGGMAACAGSPAVKPPAPPVKVPESWTAAETPPGEPRPEWWKDFGDALLDGLVTEALGRSFSLKSAATRVEAALAQARIAGADVYPLLSAGGTGLRQRQNFIGLPIPGGPEVLSTTYTSFGISLDLAWEVDLWGRLRARESAALADAEAAGADYAGAQLSLAAQSAKAYFAAVEARRQVELARSTAGNNREVTARIRDRYVRGLRPALDLRLSEANLAASEATLRLREEQLDRALRQLETLLGRYPAAQLGTAEDLPGLPPPVPAGLPSELVTRRPDLVAAERRLAAAGQRIREARASLYPQVRLTASGGTASSELSDLLDKDFRVWNVVGNLLAPLFQGGRLRAGVDLARANVQQALALYAEAVLRAFSEVETALASERILAERETALREAVEQSRAAYGISQQRYAGGLVDIVTLLDAQQRLFAAESQLLGVRRARLEARVNLHLALGGGFVREPEGE